MTASIGHNGAMALVDGGPVRRPRDGMQLAARLCALALIVALVAGCGSSAPPADSGSGLTSPVSASSAAATTTADGSGVLRFEGATWSTAYGFGAVWVQVDPPVDQIVRIDAATETVTWAIDRGRGVAFTTDAVWVAVGGEEIQKLDPDSGEVLLTVPLQTSYLAAGLGSIWAPTPQGLARVDDQTGDVLATIPIPEVAELTDVAVSDSAVWVTAKDGGKVVQVDPATNTVVASIPTGSGAHDIVVDDNGVWVTNYRANSVSRIDPVTGQVVATIDGVGSGVGIDTGGDAVWVSNKSFGIYRIDPATNQATLVIERPGWSYGLAYTEGGLWVSGTDTREVAHLALPDD